MLHILWDKELCSRVDGVLLVVAFAVDKAWVWFDEGGAKASHGSYDWDLGEGITADTCPEIHVYVGFYDILLDELSDSVYGGCV